MMKNKLAIVIPAYKSNYFDKTLQSIANQTNKNFVLYIGNDAGDRELQNIVIKYEDQVKIVYKEFRNNLGKESLVKQWNRCVDLVKEEKFVWFFSDDDIMEPNCVDKFYEELAQTKELYDVYRFNTRSIGPTDEIIFENHEHPEIETSNEFARMRLIGERLSAACEYIFKLNAFREIGGFIDFPKAWCSDDATWIKLASLTGIKKIHGAKVNWRTSNESISGSKDYKKSKIIALRSFLVWSLAQSYLLIDKKFKKKQKYWIYDHYIQYLNNVKLIDWICLLINLSKLHKDSLARNLFYLIVFIKNYRFHSIKLKSK
jgi:glycosyltransferase involved in cell wall biosynthesis